MLGLPEPFVIDRYDVDDIELSVRIHVRYGASDYVGPDGDLHRLYDHAPEREWQHLALFQYKCLIVCRVPRYIDSDGKVRTVPVPWAEGRKGHTHLFAAHLTEALLAVKVQSKVAQIFRTTPYVIRSVMEGAVSRGMVRRGTVQGLQCVSIDEKAYSKGHSYASILIDDQRGAVLDLVKDRTEKSTRELFVKVTGQQVCPTIERVNLDMWHPFMKVAAEVAPDALQVHDKFHLFKKLSEAIDHTRRKEVKQQPILKKNRYAVLKNAENRNEQQQRTFEQIDEMNLLTAQAWRIRENFKTLFVEQEMGKPELFAQWASNALEANITAVDKVVKTFQKHLKGILNAALTGTTSAKHERTNGNIQSVLAKARGFKSFDRFRINVLFYFGKLNLSPLRI